MDGFLLINKPIGWTSRDVCNKISHMLHVKKCGHVGTLDPFASGLLLVCVGNATKTVNYINHSTKEYIATLSLGKKTTSLDITGEVIETKEVPELSILQIEEVLKSFVGKITQQVPYTSATHVNGRKLYSLYYQGIEVERPFKEVEVKDISLVSYINNAITFKVTVSKGTYIRVLGESIAEKLNTIGYLSSLERTKIGDFDLNESISVTDVNENKIIPISDILEKFLPKICVDEVLGKKIKDGMTLKFVDIKNDLVYFATNKNEPIAIYQRKHGDYFSCARGIWKYE